MGVSDQAPNVGPFDPISSHFSDMMIELHNNVNHNDDL